MNRSEARRPNLTRAFPRLVTDTRPTRFDTDTPAGVTATPAVGLNRLRAIHAITRMLPPWSDNR